MSDTTSIPSSAPSETYPSSCHCGHIKFDVTLSPPLSQQQVMNCNCSICQRAGYLLVLTWHNSSRSRCATYLFNSKTRHQLFCPKCGISIGIDFKDTTFPASRRNHYGISVRIFNNINLDILTYHKYDGVGAVPPNGKDLSGIQWEIDEAERLEKEKGKSS
ncbi:hypothetical protein QBC38DRAFT_415615 [Podospora fimiseda]|uniref:CENP-V/GFA domain-containing protein n=1 Tax=Podospora fimiseda TaxID=252190 RepID=A0AAN7GVN9_9PEZI|nr:hypothetical protein QBC38DRAFT_415615 [Podospora fimiseda]